MTFTQTKSRREWVRAALFAAGARVESAGQTVKSAVGSAVQETVTFAGGSRRGISAVSAWTPFAIGGVIAELVGGVDGATFASAAQKFTVSDILNPMILIPVAIGAVLIGVAVIGSHFTDNKDKVRIG